jgi:fused signal recognition particle receptor
MSRLFRRKDDVPKRSLWDRFKDVARMDLKDMVRGVDPGSLEALEELLILGYIRTDEDFRKALSREIEKTLRKGNADPALHKARSGPTVMLVIGVNGAGKTTFIGKLAADARARGQKVLVGAADTFRAGAIDQLRVWAERAGAEFVGGAPGSDPASVAYGAVDAGVTRGMDLVIVDTAGRLHTSDDLMTELRKIHRVIAKRLPEAPHEILLVLDGTIGQNALAQARVFAASVPVSGIVVTKLDGTARGGIVVAVHEALDVPIKFVGLGEKIGDLEPFDAGEYATELVEA